MGNFSVGFNFHKWAWTVFWQTSQINLVWSSAHNNSYTPFHVVQIKSFPPSAIDSHWDIPLICGLSQCYGQIMEKRRLGKLGSCIYSSKSLFNEPKWNVIQCWFSSNRLSSSWYVHLVCLNIVSKERLAIYIERSSCCNNGKKIVLFNPWEPWPVKINALRRRLIASTLKNT